MKAKVVPLEKKKDCCRSYGGTRCKIYKHVVKNEAFTETFRSFSTQREFRIKHYNLNCRSSNVVYLSSCKACSKQYRGTVEPFDLDLKITSQPRGVSLKGILTNKCHFKFTLSMTNIMV